MGSLRAVLLISGALLCQSALAQETKQATRLQTTPPEWQSSDGSVQFTIPAGWHRQNLAVPQEDPNAVLQVSQNGEPGFGQAWVRCTVLRQALAPGVTQEALNSRVYEGIEGGQLRLTSPRVRKVNGVTVVDGAITVPDARDVQMLFSVVRNGKGYMFS